MFLIVFNSIFNASLDDYVLSNLIYIFPFNMLKFIIHFSRKKQESSFINDFSV
jgi:hypothetical protein